MYIQGYQPKTFKKKKMKLEVLVRQYSIIIIRGSPMWTISLTGNAKTSGLSSPPLVTNVAGKIHSDLDYNMEGRV